MLKQYFRSAYFLPSLHDAGTPLVCPTKPSISFLYSQQQFAYQRGWNDLNVRYFIVKRVWEQLEKQRRSRAFLCAPTPGSDYAVAFKHPRKSGDSFCRAQVAKLKQGEGAQLDVKQVVVRVTPCRSSPRQYLHVTQNWAAVFKHLLRNKSTTNQAGERLGCVGAYLKTFIYISIYSSLAFAWCKFYLAHTEGLKKAYEPSAHARNLYQPPTAPTLPHRTTQQLSNSVLNQITS